MTHVKSGRHENDWDDTREECLIGVLVKTLSPVDMKVFVCVNALIQVEECRQLKDRR